MKRRPLWLRRFCAWLTPAKRLVVVNDDTLPARLPLNSVVLARDDGEDWCVGLTCPCGCGDLLEMMVLQTVKPRWDVRKDARGRPTLHPSVYRNTGCRSHFWVRSGKIIWCD